jgi:hypothetical protein
MAGITCGPSRTRRTSNHSGELEGHDDPMNEIKISGVLENVEEHRAPRGEAFITVTLHFDKSGRGILLLAVGPRTRQLVPFDCSDSVRVIGRLAHFRNGFAVLLDECSPWTIARQSRHKFAYQEAQSQKSIRALEAEA